MHYRSTRNPDAVFSLSESIAKGLAADGGLFVPDRLPSRSVDEFDGLETLPDIAACLLAPFFDGDALEPELADICREAFGFAIPLRELPAEDGRLSVLELFHGPTAAFKDVGARFLAACLQRINAGSDEPLTILVATSGDTGGAVAAAFEGRAGTEVDILYPAGMVSPRQEQQLTCWTGNVRAFRVAGAFDDCQRLVKAAFQDAALNERLRLCSANSINIGRLLPQMCYYAAASLWYLRANRARPSFIVPTGNLGNALACVYARHCGLPIDRIVLATNANRTIPDFLSSGEWLPRASIATLASAMDVGDPSNMERLRGLFRSVDDVRDAVSAIAVDDERIREQIRVDCERSGEVWCPHTATAMYAYQHLSVAERTDAHWIAVATAHPAKFETIVEPLVGHAVPVPPALARLMDLPSRFVEIQPDLGQLAAHL